MNPIEEQRSLVEFLESAVEEARGSGSLERIEGLEKLLKEARWEYARLKVSLQSGPVTKSLQSPEVSSTKPPLPSVPSSIPENKTLAGTGALTMEPPMAVDSPSKGAASEITETPPPKLPVIVPSVPKNTASGGPSRPTPSSDLELNLTYTWEPRYKILLNNLKSVFSHEVKVYQVSSRPIETNLVLESQPWYKSLVENVKSIFSPEKKDYSSIT